MTYIILQILSIVLLVGSLIVSIALICGEIWLIKNIRVMPLIETILFSAYFFILLIISLAFTFLGYVLVFTDTFM